VAVLGERPLVEGFALAGALVVAAGTAEEVRAGWRALPPDVALVVVTPAAAAALDGLAGSRASGRLTVTVPE
jgi:hypothetical protein